MATYVYCNLYERLGHTYLYVGKHSWDGPRGKLDPNYHGSSFIICPELGHQWSRMSHPLKERYRQLASEFTLKEEILLLEDADSYDEATVIEFFAQLYGCSLERANDWSRQFRLGSLLNRHSLAVAPETHRKIADNRKKNGTYAHCTEHLNTPEMHARSAAAHNFKENARRRLENQKKRGTVSGGLATVEIYENGKKLFIGSQMQCDKFTASLGRRVSQTWLSKHPNQARNGFEFKQVSIIH